MAFRKPLNTCLALRSSPEERLNSEIETTVEKLQTELCDYWVINHDPRPATRDPRPETRGRQRLDTVPWSIIVGCVGSRIATVLHKLASRCAVAITGLSAQNKP